VQGPRTQSDRALYRQAMQIEFGTSDLLTVIESGVKRFTLSGNTVTGVVLADGNTLSAGAVILTAGTFLRGVIHIGDKTSQGGRLGDIPSNSLAEQIDKLGLPLGRLKTGTPPRLDGKTIDWSILEVQQADPEPVLFSFLPDGKIPRQIGCGITHTNPETHDIIRNNLDKSAIYGGKIDGVGPRYCPSIEDKVVRFADKNSHQIFLEPEGLSTNMVYPNGISTSLPLDIQVAFVQSIKGLQQAKITQPGYAIEYDYVDPRALGYALNVKSIDGLYFAGQINGTTGYEEAAAQGLMAGLNAAAKILGKEPFIVDRSTGYIGVMIDDLVTRGVSEPYRMFTSRAEYRLSLRADNADQRLTRLGFEFGCVSSLRNQIFDQKMENLARANKTYKSLHLGSAEASSFGIVVNQNGRKRSGLDLLNHPEVNTETLAKIWPETLDIDPEIRLQVERDAKYAMYIDRQKRDIEILKRDEAHRIPDSFDYAGISGLSNELTEKLTRVQPETLGQAGRIDGMTSAALTLLLAMIRKSDARQRA